MSMQEQVRQAFRDSLSDAGDWEPAVILGMLAAEMRNNTSFTGVFHDIVDFDVLSDEQATYLCSILPKFVKDLPDIS